MRESVLEFEDDFELNTDINISHGITGNNVLVVFFEYILNLDLKSEDKLLPQFKYSSTHVAQFELEESAKNEEDFENKLERFANINAAAIIFPFIRENAATISAKAGMSPIIIPVTNFVKLYEEKNK
ncbi:protein-export chaperone SecB [Chryseobacterium fluminis]|uniref:protein-export chaperone SecB n=1 Tax=Chryseobacterium fluminis TaxID=2983606 RepID=UPI00224F5699|nr:protein-export chaperone SecB [Chryseobacterium sp. MMS21-Ot14]UZU00050.1 protein-export chaperone SecB [Chryseobacterium sp. MMS21-Ot14]